MIEERCDNCKFYEPVDDGMGECHRHPPVFFPFRLWAEDEEETDQPRADLMNQTKWPVVEDTDFCGEFKPI